MMRRKPTGTGLLFEVPPPPAPKPEVPVPPPVSAPDPGTPIVAERTFRLVREPEEDQVIVEPLEDGRFIVSLLRHHGTTVARVIYTRAQLEMLIRRIPAALGVG